MSKFEPSEQKRFSKPQEAEWTATNAMNQLEFLLKESPEKIASNLETVFAILDQVDITVLSPAMAKKLMTMLAKAQPRPPVEKNPRAMQDFVELTVKQGRYLNDLKRIADRPTPVEKQPEAPAPRPAPKLVRKPRPQEVKEVPGVTKALETIKKTPEAEEDEDWVVEAKEDVGKRTAMMRTIKKQPAAAPAQQKGSLGRFWDMIRGK